MDMRHNNSEYSIRAFVALTGCSIGANDIRAFVALTGCSIWQMIFVHSWL